ncbi:MAG: SOS response-associated peptidase [Gemmatimonadetes bacterium]|nr:SOS response-associated peptidase [Gemmatimonadota bacterium]
MCGRYTIRHPQRLDPALFGAEGVGVPVARYNIAPGQAVPLVRSVGGSRALTMAQWGLIPSWAKDPAIGGKLANARGETLAEKPSFRSAWKARRGLMPADGFYEWQKVPGARSKQPWFIAMADDAPFALGALWETWREPDGAHRVTCCVITTEPNDVMRPIHERMPVIVPRDGWARWLGEAGGVSPPDDLLAPYDASPMRAWPVSTMVNAPTRDDPRMVEPLAE